MPVGQRRLTALVAEAGARVMHAAHGAPGDLVRVRPVRVPCDGRWCGARDAQALQRPTQVSLNK